MKGSLFAFSIGDKAIFRTKEGKAYNVIVRSELKTHKDTDQLVRELEFLDSPEGPGLWAVNADQIEPIDKVVKILAIISFLKKRKGRALK